MTSVEFLNPFIVAAAEVLQATVSANVSRGMLSLERSSDTVSEVTVALSLIGEVQGTVLYSLSQKTALELVGQMMGSPIDEMDDLAKSGIAELGNIITGRAVTKLSNAGYETDISTPNVVIGKDVRISTQILPRIVVPLKMQYGSLEVHLAITNGTNGTSA